ncbi:MAG: mechanosensitive ion channel domain-containing protein [Sphingomonadales bacterium]
MSAQAQEIYDLLIEMAVTYGMSMLFAIVILIVGFWFATRAKNIVIRAMRRSKKIDETIIIFAGSMVRYLVIIFTVLAVLDQFGVETTSLIALLGAAGLAIGFALQGTLSNVAAGVMLLFFRPFRVGQFVDVGGTAGTVKGVGLFTTHLDTGDNVHIIVPNANIWGASIKNFSHNKNRRIDLLIGIGYGDDIDKAMKVILSTIKAQKLALDDPAPLVVVGELGGSSVDLVVRTWCKNGDYWAVRWALIKAIKENFDKEGIEIPYPQTVIHQA